MTFALIRLEGVKKSFYLKRPVKNEAYFFFRSLKRYDTGRYFCFYYDGSSRGSLLSDVQKVWVTGKNGARFGRMGFLDMKLPLASLDMLISQTQLMVGRGTEFVQLDLECASPRVD